jgi:ferredoxin
MTPSPYRPENAASEARITFVIAPPCVADYSCVEACPADAISPRPDEPAFERTDQLFIDPEVCIGCAACVEACPVGAIFDSRRLPPRWATSVELNRSYFRETAHG